MCQNPAFALDQHVARCRCRRPYERKIKEGAKRIAPHPFNARTRLAGAAAGEIEPDLPVAGRWELVGSSEKFPVVRQSFGRFRRHRGQDALGYMLGLVVEPRCGQLLRIANQCSIIPTRSCNRPSGYRWC
jgi:hypothetical protein